MNTDRVVPLRAPRIYHKATFKHVRPAMVVLHELPCDEYNRGRADGVAQRERRQHIAPVHCSRVVLLDGTPVYRVFIYLGEDL